MPDQLTVQEVWNQLSDEQKLKITRAIGVLAEAKDDLTKYEKNMLTIMVLETINE